jgi:hypothetical protein
MCVFIIFIIFSFILQLFYNNTIVYYNMIINMTYNKINDILQ